MRALAAARARLNEVSPRQITRAPPCTAFIYFTLYLRAITRTSGPSISMPFPLKMAQINSFVKLLRVPTSQITSSLNTFTIYFTLINLIDYHDLSSTIRF